LKNNRIKIADFGSAKELSISSNNSNNDCSATAKYMSPEILKYSKELKNLNLKKEKITFKTDIW